MQCIYLYVMLPDATLHILLVRIILLYPFSFYFAYTLFHPQAPKFIFTKELFFNVYFVWCRFLYSPSGYMYIYICLFVFFYFLFDNQSS